MKTLQDRIRKLRGTTTQVEFAKLLDIPVNTLGRYERGVNSPDFDFFIKINSIFGVSLDWLILGTEDKNGQVRDGITHPIQQSPQTGTACTRCLELYEKIDKMSEQQNVSSERLYSAMKENGDLKEKVGKLENEIEHLKNALSAYEDDAPMSNAS